MALELLPSRLQATKEYTPLPAHERQKQLFKEITDKKHENNYYRTCYDTYQKLLAIVVEACRNLNLQACFEPVSTLRQDPFLDDVIRRLNVAVEESRTREIQAEIVWKQYWNIPQTSDVSLRRI
jgi:hypothetical protein